MISHAHMLNPLRWLVGGVFMAQRHPLRFHTLYRPPVAGGGSHRVANVAWAYGGRVGVRVARRVRLLARAIHRRDGHSRR